MKHVACALFVAALAGSLGDADAQARRTDLAPEIMQSIALRARHRIPLPSGQAVVYIDSISVHHTRQEASTVAARGPSGRWYVSTVSEEGPGLVSAKQRVTDHVERTLSNVEGRRLDELLKQAVLEREKPKAASNPVVGAVFHTMEINHSSGHTVIRWQGRLAGVVGEVADLLIGRG